MSEQRQPPIPAIELPSSNSGRTSKGISPNRTMRSQSTAEQDGPRKSIPNPSPTRSSAGGSTSIPSAAAVQRALSTAKAAANNNETVSDTVRDRKQRSPQNTPHWPVSPRLKSPPPASSRSISGRMIDGEYVQPGSSIRRLATVSSADTGAAMVLPQDLSKKTSNSQPTLKPPGRGASAPGTGLETVDESSLPSTPSMSSTSLNGEEPRPLAHAADQGLDGTVQSSANKDSTSVVSVEAVSKPVTERIETAPAARATSTSRAQTQLARRSLTSLTGKAKNAVEPLRTMTVETEAVNSTPALITDRGRDGSSLRTRPSIETIRPKKEKKKPPRKAPSLHAGTHSSKADIFEAKVASAVDEADSTDSDETFVYESNPPEPRHTRHHSRTPSATSLASQMDHHGTRGKHGLRNNSTAVGGKKSMKFSNSIYSAQLEPEGPGDGRGSTRTTSSTPRHHHINRHGRSGHPSIIDTNSPFDQVNRATSPRTPTARSSRPSSPRTSNGRLHFSRKAAAAGYDTYEDGADDERVPLMSSVRINRNKHSRRPNSSHFRAMHFVEEEESPCWPRFSGCFLLGGLITLVCVSITVFIVFLNRSLVGVQIERIQNVLASEQEIMLDLVVRATNPNIFPIVVQHLDVSIFAQSPYVGTALEFEEPLPLGRITLTQRRRQVNSERPRTAFWFPPVGDNGGVDEGTDPVDDPELGDPDLDDPAWGNQKMLLGSILAFDSALTFPPTPFNPHSSLSVGEIRLQRPGHIELGGIARWERVLQHQFELIVRGVIKYQLPLSSSMRSTQIMDRISVSPGGDSDDGNTGDDDNSGDGTSDGTKRGDPSNSTSPTLALLR